MTDIKNSVNESIDEFKKFDWRDYVIVLAVALILSIIFSLVFGKLPFVGQVIFGTVIGLVSVVALKFKHKFFK